ncbi:hypothetical protein C8J57DRAFT_1361611 [Mycena rebaudengoi]|nr:hypothetical protein C8J57DRAFT_1361611 [Mycena rebaudengoi]
MAALHRPANFPFDFLRFPWAKTLTNVSGKYNEIEGSCVPRSFTGKPWAVVADLVAPKYLPCFQLYLSTYLPCFYTFERRNSPRSFNSNSLHALKLQPRSCSSALAVFRPFAARHFMYIVGHCHEIHYCKIHRLPCPLSYSSTIFVRTRPPLRIPLEPTVLHSAGSRGSGCLLIHVVRRVQCVDVV